VPDGDDLTTGLQVIPEPPGCPFQLHLERPIYGVGSAMTPSIADAATTAAFAL
jgi:hypothetical protein